jgi:hypothetical protein
MSDKAQNHNLGDGIKLPGHVTLSRMMHENLPSQMLHTGVMPESVSYLPVGVSAIRAFRVRG